MRQHVMEASSRSKDLFLIDSKIPQYCAFPFEFPMTGTICALFGDDGSGVISNGIRNYLQSTFGPADSSNPNYSDSYVSSSMMGFLLKHNVLINTANRFPMINRVSFATGIRKYYSTSGILVVRPASGDGLHATFKLLGGGEDKGGGHNHDDAGSYQILLKGLRVAGDVGGITYSGELKKLNLLLAV